jgi:thiol-disulfide isomerase/thioredoxin
MTRNGFGRIWSRSRRRVTGKFLLLAMLAWIGHTAKAAAPPNDQFANAAALEDLGPLTISNTGATVETGEPTHAGEPTQSTLWWKWVVPFTATFSVSTSNSVAANNLPLDTVAAVYTGDSVSDLTYVSANDDTAYGELGALWSRCVFRAYVGETLMIAVGSLGNTGTIRLNVNVAGPYMNYWQAAGLHGGTLSSSNFSGQVLMIDFWETICGACIEELPVLIRLQTGLAPRGFTLIGLSGDADIADVVEYVETSGINYPIAMSTPGIQNSIAGGPVGYPTKLLVDRENRIVGTYLGINTEKGYRGIVEQLMRPDPRLRVQVARENGNITLRWPASESGYKVERAAKPAGDAWSLVEISPVITNGQHVVITPAIAEAEFFRLKKP